MAADSFLTCRCNILTTTLFQDVLRRGDFLRGIAVHRDENSPVLYASLVTFGLILGNAHPDQRTDHTPDSPAYSKTG